MPVVKAPPEYVHPLVQSGFLRWSSTPPPKGVPLIVYCDVNRVRYRQALTADQVTHNWPGPFGGVQDQVEQDLSRVWWKLTAVARAQLYGPESVEPCLERAS